ncbi:MAG TPA: DNA topoisomerase I, partial [Thermoplasmatales archaeon]|nr:DNA topoisomerase I [Thermoplasmatales archaeon]
MKLVICEKRTAANRIAWILSGGKFKTYKFGKTPYYSFERDGENWVVVGLKGHIISLDFPKELNRWNSVPLEELIWAEPVKFVSEKSIEKLLEKFAKENPEIII